MATNPLQMKPTIVIIGAGWHTPNSYSKLTKSLHDAGFEVYVPMLFAMTGSPYSKLKDDSQMVRDLVESLCETGRSVLVLMHGYGGQVGTDGLFGLGMPARAGRNVPGGVTYLVYMAAFALEEGLSILDGIPEDTDIAASPLRDIFCMTSTNSVGYGGVRWLVGWDGPSNEAIEYDATMRPWNYQTLWCKTANCAWKEIPAVYIYTVNDNILPYTHQSSMVAAMGRRNVSVKTFQVETGHCPNLTATDEVVAIIERITHDDFGK